VASEKLARFDGLMDGDHSRLYGYGFSYVYRKSPMLALRFSGATQATDFTSLVNLTTSLLVGRCGTRADKRLAFVLSSSPPPPARGTPHLVRCGWPAAMSFGEDYDLVRRALEAGHVVRHVALNAASPPVLHLLHGGNTSRSVPAPTRLWKL
jgi:hypothetical protein